MAWRKIDQILAEPDMIPLVDMLFQLLLCLTIVSNFEGTKAEERVKLAENALARPPEINLREELVLEVGFSRDPLEQSPRRETVVFYRGEEVPLGRMHDNLERDQQMFEGARGRGDVGDVSVIIRAEAEVPTGVVQSLIKTCQDVGFVKFALKSAQNEN